MMLNKRLPLTECRTSIKKRTRDLLHGKRLVRENLAPHRIFLKPQI